MLQDEIEEGDTRLTQPPPGTRSPPVLPEGPFTPLPSPLLSQASIETASSCQLLSVKFPADSVPSTENFASKVGDGPKKDVIVGLGTGVSLQAFCGGSLPDWEDSMADNKTLAQHAKVSPSCMQALCQYFCCLQSFSILFL